MKHAKKIPRIQRLLSLPPETNRHCEKPVKGQTRWRGFLRSPLTEPPQFRSTTPLWKRKKNDKSNNNPQASKVSISTPEYGAVFHPHEQWEYVTIRGGVRMALHQARTISNSSSAIDRAYDAVDGALYALQLPR
jgi:hypothetical protein